MRRAGALLAILALAGCGSTVQVSHDVAAGRPDGLGVLDPGTSTGLPGRPAPVDGPALPGAPVAGPSGRAPSAAPLPLASASAVPVVAGPARGRPVPVGVAYLSNVGEAFGQSDPEAPDLRLQAATMVRWVNAHGGLGGRPITPVYSTVDLTDTRPYDESAAAICESWTNDHQVVAGLFLANMNTTLPDCLNRRGVMFLNMATYFFDSVDYRHIPLMVNPGAMEGDLGARTYIEGLFAQGFLKAGEKVGVLRFSTPTYTRAYQNAMKPALNEGGITFIDEYAINQPASTPDLANSAAAVQNAVLKMRTDGVTTVLFLCSGCAGVFMQYADSQEWLPRYGLSSWDVPHFRENGAPRRQLEKAQGVGWTPLLDVPHVKAPGTNATSALCESLMHPIRQADTQDERIGSYAYCDVFLTLWRAGQGLSHVDGRALVASTEKLASSYSSAFNLRTSLGPRRHYGVAARRFFAYDKACPCFRYTSSPVAIG